MLIFSFVKLCNSLTFMQETCHCILTGKAFILTQQDLDHYQKTALPLPKLCPEERLRRRLQWRNERTFYKRTCDLCKKTMLSMYTEDSLFTVYCTSCWWSDSWNAHDFGKVYDKNRNFLDQYAELMRCVPRMSMDLVHCENSDFCNYSGDDKNCYFDIGGEANEDCYYNFFTKYSRNCVDNTFLYNSSLCYECIQCHNSYNCLYSTYCNDSSDLFFCYDMRGCRNCLFSYNLRNKEYYIFNQPHTKEEYFNTLKVYRLSSFTARENALQTWRIFLKENAVFRDMYLTNTENCTGDMITDSKNTHIAFNVLKSEDSKYLYDVLDAKNCFDLNYSLYKPELSTELINTLNLTYSAYSLASHYCSSIFYSDMCNNSKNLFGCIALNRKENCILNKQYSPQDYEELKSYIIHAMKSDGSFGEFFPGTLSPHAYNETAAQNYFPLTRDEAIAAGFRWKEKDIKEYQASCIVLPDEINEAQPSIVHDVLACNTCGRNYRLIMQEFSFYKEHKIPLPRECSQCRHLKRHASINPRILCNRTCTNCGTDIQSTFSSDCTEKVFCEKCYQAALY